MRPTINTDVLTAPSTITQVNSHAIEWLHRFIDTLGQADIC